MFGRTGVRIPWVRSPELFNNFYYWWGAPYTNFDVGYSQINLSKLDGYGGTFRPSLPLTVVERIVVPLDVNCSVVLEGRVLDMRAVVEGDNSTG